MRTRRNKQNEGESLDKIKQIRDDNDKILAELLNAMEQKEKVKKHLINLNQLTFEAEVSQIMEGNVSKEIEQNYQKEELEINKINFVYLEKKTNLAENKDLYKKKINDDDYEEQEKVVRSTKNCIKRISRKSNIDNNSNNKNSTDDSSKYQSSSSINIKDKINQKKRVEKLNKELIKTDENCLKLRLRYNRANRIVIDRYIQNDNSMNPFDDSINKVINCYNSYGKDLTYCIDNKNYFGYYFDRYFKGYLGDFFFFSDSDDDNFDIDIKKFQNDHKSFLKNKRTHS